MNSKKTIETKAVYSALIAAGFILTLLSLPSFQLGKLWDGIATMAVCLLVVVANICLFWEFLSRPAWRKPVPIMMGKRRTVRPRPPFRS
jgi:protein-S-isoprenylcysteine O-methyltransferase Ste14